MLSSKEQDISRDWKWQLTYSRYWYKIWDSSPFQVCCLRGQDAWGCLQRWTDSHCLMRQVLRRESRIIYIGYYCLSVFSCVKVSEHCQDVLGADKSKHIDVDFFLSIRVFWCQWQKVCYSDKALQNTIFSSLLMPVAGAKAEGEETPSSNVCLWILLFCTICRRFCRNITL